jgi:hypothetical protein
MDKNINFIKKNICPHCTYPCDSATMIKGEDKPRPGCLSFCLMCCEPSVFDDNMKLIKFDLNTITDIIERNRIKVLGMRVHEFWDIHPDTDGQRAMYLKKMDKINGKTKRL